MKLKSFIISILILITIAVGYIVSLLIKEYRVYVFISTETTPSEIERLGTMMKYQNLIWVFLAVIILGLISLIVIENKDKIQGYLKKF